jgi:hypothetical protein
MRTSARGLAKPVPKQGTLMGVVVDEAVEVVMDVEAGQVVENVLPGVTVPRRAPTLPTLVWPTSTALGRCIVLNVMGGMILTQRSIMMSSNGLPPLSRSHLTILIGFCRAKSTLLLLQLELLLLRPQEQQVVEPAQRL